MKRLSVVEMAVSAVAVVGGVALGRAAAARGARRAHEALSMQVSRMAAQQRALRAELRDTRAWLERHQDETSRMLRTLEYEPVSEVVAALQLLQRVTASAPLPPVGGWAVEPSGLLRAVSEIQLHRPALVVECGSGSSSVWLGHALAATGGRLVSLEHDAQWVAQTRAMLAEHGLGDVVEVRHAPLVEVAIQATGGQATGGEVGGEPGGEHASRWYDPAALADLHDIGVLLIDGPPKATGAHARQPALPFFHSRLADRAVVLLDDAERPDEREALAAWLAQWPDLARRPSPSRRMVVLERDVRQASVGDSRA